MDAQERLKAECGIVARFLFGASALEFHKRLPTVCTWLQDVPEGHLRKLASDCSWAANETALEALLELRSAVPGLRHRAFAESLQMAEQGPGGTTVRVLLDHVADAGYISFAESPYLVERTHALTDRINLDYGADGTLVGIELLGVS